MKFIPVILDVDPTSFQIKQATLEKGGWYQLKVVDVIQLDNDVVQILQYDGKVNVEKK